MAAGLDASRVSVTSPGAAAAQASRPGAAPGAGPEAAPGAGPGAAPGAGPGAAAGAGPGAGRGAGPGRHETGIPARSNALDPGFHGVRADQGPAAHGADGAGAAWIGF